MGGAKHLSRMTLSCFVDGDIKFKMWDHICVIALILSVIKLAVVECMAYTVLFSDISPCCAQEGGNMY